MIAIALSLILGGPHVTSVIRVPVAAAETLTVESRGDGPTVALIPGLFGGAYSFRAVAATLAEHGYRAVSIEPLGFGSSSRPAGGDYSLSAQAARIGAVLDSMGLSGVILVGHSAGAAMAYRLALARPDLVRAIVSLEGGPAETAATPGFRRAMALAPLLRMAGRGFVRERIRSGLRAASGDPAWVTDATLTAYTSAATADLGPTLQAFQRIAASREPEPLAPRLAQLPCAVTLLLGAVPHDGGPSADEVARLQRAVPVFDLVRLPGAGHYLQEERPADVVRAVERHAERMADRAR